MDGDRISLQQFLRKLECSTIHFDLHRIRDDTIMVDVSVPGERWEVEFFEDGSIEIDRFRSDGHIGGAELLDELFRDFSDIPGHSGDSDRNRTPSDGPIDGE